MPAVPGVEGGGSDCGNDEARGSEVDARSGFDARRDADEDACGGEDARGGDDACGADDTRGIDAAEGGCEGAFGGCDEPWGGCEETCGLRALYAAQHVGHRHSNPRRPCIRSRVTRHLCFEMSVYWVSVCGAAFWQSMQIVSDIASPP
jgi:hypothetical protein